MKKLRTLRHAGADHSLHASNFSVFGIPMSGVLQNAKKILWTMSGKRFTVCDAHAGSSGIGNACCKCNETVWQWVTTSCAVLIPILSLFFVNEWQRSASQVAELCEGDCAFRSRSEKRTVYFMYRAKSLRQLAYCHACNYSPRLEQQQRSGRFDLRALQIL